MSSRHRQSTARSIPSRPSVAPTPSRNNADELPPYKKPSHPLDNDAQRAIAVLQGRSDLKKHSKNAVVTISTAAENINDMLREHAAYIERRQKKWEAGKNLDTKEEEEREMQELRQKVKHATDELEQSMRAVIDSGIAAQRIEDALEWLRQNAPAQLEQEYQTQMTQRATQRQSQTQRQDADGDEPMDDNDALTPGPTPLDGSRVALTGASELYTSRLQRQKNAYTSLSLTARYAKNNDYRDFKRIVHDATYGDSGPELGHEDTWFTDTGSPAPGVTDTRRGALEDDDDIIVDKVKMSTTCPITFQQYKDPITSAKCPHTFERNAILDMIRNSSNRLGGGGQRGAGEKAVECPCTGCSQILTASDLRTDPIIARKIRRLQQASREEAEESDDGGGDEDDDDDDDDNGHAKEQLQAKNNGRGTQQQQQQQQQQRQHQQPPQSSIIEDLGDPSDEEDDED